MEKPLIKQVMYYCSGKTYAFILAAAVLAATCVPLNTQAQKRTAKKMLREANADYSEGLYGSAWPLYRWVLSMQGNNEKAAVNAAHCAVKLNYPADSVKKISSSLESGKSHESLYFLAMIAHQEKRFEQAMELVARYAAIPPAKRLFTEKETTLLKDYCRNAMAFYKSPSPAAIRNMGSAINSVYADYVPVIMPDESAIYFTSKRNNPEHPARNGDGTFFEDVYVSHRRQNSWAAAESVGFPVNTETNDACVAISPDGQRMIIYRTAPDLATGDLYLSVMGDGNRWQHPQKMTDKINSPHIETSACFSKDTSEIYFSSDRPGGLGGKDLYRIRRLPAGQWSEPMNLGPQINTPFDDDAPFLHPDGITLYFSSRGHNSMGDFDVFRSTWNRDENTFTQAENLGHPINDVGADIFFVLSVDGQRGYYTTTRQGDLGGTDIYEIDTRFSATDLQVRIGKIILGTNYGRAQITVKDKGTGETNGFYQSNPQSGKFILAVNPHRTYEAEITADGFKSQTVTLSPEAFEEEKSMTFVLQRSDAQ